jgi:hypothetical protein
MGDSTHARFLLAQQQRVGGIGLIPTYPAALDEEGQPSVLWGTGTPNGDLAPFTLVNKGSLYFSVDNADNVAAVYMKYDEGGDNADWVAILSSAVDDSILAEALEVNARTHIVVLPTLINISDGPFEVVPFHAVAALTITEIGLIWEEASIGGAAAGDVTIGTASGGGQIVSAVNGAYGASQAVGSYQALTLTTGAMTAGQELFISHDQVAEVGTCRVQIKYYLNS